MQLELKDKTDVDENFEWHQEPRDALLEKFVTDIRDYTTSVSSCKSPVGIILFGVSFVVALSFVLATTFSVDCVAKF